MKELLSLRFSRAAKTYEKWAIPQRKSAEILVKFSQPTGAVLDLGCGTGFVSRFLPSSCLPTGIDISANMASVYSQEFGRAVVGDAESLPFKEKSFDFVLSNFSLHWTNLDKSLTEALRVSRQGIGLAFPVEGSLEKFGFPFPPAERVLEFFSRFYLNYFFLELDIPFKGWDLMKFFHFTGSSLNPKRRKSLSRFEVERLLNSVERPFFRVLFLSVRVI